MTTRPHKIVFACVRNAGRSQMAAAFFNHLADPELAQATSAGTDPGPRVQPEVVTVMKEVGLDLSRARPRLFTDEVAAHTRVLVTMGCGEECPWVPSARHEDWPLSDPHGLDIAGVRQVRDDIHARVRQLIETENWGRAAEAPARPSA